MGGKEYLVVLVNAALMLADDDVADEVTEALAKCLLQGTVAARQQLVSELVVPAHTAACMQAALVAVEPDEDTAVTTVEELAEVATEHIKDTEVLYGVRFRCGGRDDSVAPRYNVGTRVLVTAPATATSVALSLPHGAHLADAYLAIDDSTHTGFASFTDRGVQVATERTVERAMVRQLTPRQAIMLNSVSTELRAAGSPEALVLLFEHEFVSTIIAAQNNRRVAWRLV